MNPEKHVRSWKVSTSDFGKYLVAVLDLRHDFLFRTMGCLSGDFTWVQIDKDEFLRSLKCQHGRKIVEITCDVDLNWTEKVCIKAYAERIVNDNLVIPPFDFCVSM